MGSISMREELISVKDLSGNWVDIFNCKNSENKEIKNVLEFINLLKEYHKDIIDEDSDFLIYDNEIYLLTDKNFVMNLE
jgi:hypothetical protein